MARSKAATVEQYLAELPPDRRAELGTVRDLVLQWLPEGYLEVMNWGMICYELPLAHYPNTYNKQPLSYVALAAQKNHLALHLNSFEADGEREAELRAAFAAAGKKLDTGKSCVRFRKADDLELEAIGRAIASLPPDQFIAIYEKSRTAADRR